MSQNYKNKLESLKKARAAKHLKYEENKKIKLSIEEQLEKDLKEIEKVGDISKTIFGKKQLYQHYKIN